MKLIVSEAIFERAQENLFPSGALTSKSGMTRKELRALERRGDIKKSYVKVNDTTFECFWELR